MKKYISFLTFFLYALLCFAQPSLDASNTNPVIGESFDMHKTAWETAGSGGANVTWNFLHLYDSGLLSVPIVDPSTTTNGAEFPDANISYELGNNSYYYKNSTQKSQLVGAYVYSGDVDTTIIYDDYIDELRFTMNYNESYTDDAAGHFTFKYSGNLIDFERDGSVDVSADGYGTLITPEGTYTDVLRVKQIETHRDSGNYWGLSIIMNNTVEIYKWYKPGVHFPILIFAEYNFPDIPENQKLAYYMDGNSVNIDKLKNSKQFFYPNPADKVIYLKDCLNCEIAIYNVIGNTVKYVKSGKDVIDISNITEGLYFISRNCEGKTSTGKLIVK
jgi:hypothetical protein